MSQYARILSMLCLVLLLASSSLWAFPKPQTASAEATAGGTQGAEVPQGEPRTGFGTPFPSPLTESAQQSQVTAETVTKLEDGKRLSKEESAAIAAEIEKVREDIAVLRGVSEDKDKVIQEQADTIKRLSKQTGTKWGVMGGVNAHVIEGDLLYGLGVDAVARLGNHLLLSAGLNLDLGDFSNGFSSLEPEDLGFSLKCGWMF